MDTLDDFTILDIIMLCDMRTVFGALPLVCHRLHDLYDDMVVTKRFHSDIRAQIVTHEHKRLTPDHGRTRAKLPLRLVANANLGDFTLEINVKVLGLNGQSLFGLQIFTATLHRVVTKFTYGQCMSYKTPCKLTTTFRTLCASLDTRIFNNMLVPAAHVIYYMRGLVDERSGDYCRQLNGGQSMYELGFGHKYVTLVIVIHIDTTLYRS